MKQGPLRVSMKGQLSRAPLPPSLTLCLQSLHSLVQPKQRNLKFGVFHKTSLWGLTSRKKKKKRNNNNNNSNRTTDLELRRWLGFQCVLFMLNWVILAQVEGLLLELSGGDLESEQPSHRRDRVSAV